jgi:hypothetical protein
MELVDNENIDGEEGDIVNIPEGDAVNTTSYGMSDGDDEEGEEKSAAPAAAAEQWRWRGTACCWWGCQCLNEYIAMQTPVPA